MFLIAYFAIAEIQQMQIFPKDVLGCFGCMASTVLYLAHDDAHEIALHVDDLLSRFCRRKCCRRDSLGIGWSVTTRCICYSRDNFLVGNT